MVEGRGQEDITFSINRTVYFMRYILGEMEGGREKERRGERGEKEIESWGKRDLDNRRPPCTELTVRRIKCCRVAVVPNFLIEYSVSSWHRPTF